MSSSFSVVSPSMQLMEMPAQERLQDSGRTHGVLAVLQSQCNETSVYVLSGNADATKALRMKASGKHSLMLGGVDCRLLRYDVLPRLPQQVAMNVSHDRSGTSRDVSVRAPA